MSLDKTVCFQLSLGSLSATKRVNVREIASDEIQASDGAVQALTVSKRIIDCAEHKAVKSHAQRMGVTMRARSIPSLLTDGIYLITVGQVAKTEEWARAELETRAGLVDKLSRRIESIAADEVKRLGPLGNLADYPSPDKVKSALWGRFRFLTFDVPGSLQSVSDELWRAEQEKAKALYSEIVENATAVLRAELLKLVDHMRDLTTPNRDGGRKRIFSSALAGFRDFLSGLPDRNAIADDPIVRDLAAQAAAVLDGVSTDGLRDSDALRDSVQSGMSSVRESLAPYVIEAPSRAFRFTKPQA